MAISKRAWEKKVASKQKLVAEIFALMILAAVVLLILFLCGVFDGSPEAENTEKLPEASVAATYTETAEDATLYVPDHTAAVVQTESSSDSTNGTAQQILLDTVYADSISEYQESAWYTFTTTDTPSVYRLWMKTKKRSYCTTLTLYNKAGATLDDFSVYAGHQESAFMDLLLETETQYFFKVTPNDPVDFEICVSERVCDAGTDKSTATEITLDQQQSAVANSTLGDWYVFTAPKAGQYCLTYHNIDVGAAIVCEGKTYWGSAENGASYCAKFRAAENEQVYFQIYTRKEEGNGQYTLVIESIE